MTIPKVSAGMASVMFATIPLITQLIASLIGQESLTWKGMLGALIVIAGISMVFVEQLRFGIPLVYLGSVLAGVVRTAVSGFVVKYFPGSHPFSTNAVGMGIGALLLLLLSIFAGETRVLPALPFTWLAVGWLVLSSIVGFGLIVWLAKRQPLRS